MVDMASLARRIQERRKAQCLTQEQLGQVLGVSSQAVSKWENGESMPDINLLPTLCKALGVSSDALLGIDGGVGVESLAQELGTRIGQVKNNKSDVVMIALKQILFGELLRSINQWNDDINLAFDHKQGRPVDTSIWVKNGFVAKVFPEMLTNNVSTTALGKLQTITDNSHWPIVEALLSGPKSENELAEELNTGTATPLSLGLTKLMAAGIVYQTHEGYHLDRNRALPVVSVLKAICVAFDKPQGVGVFSNQGW